MQTDSNLKKSLQIVKEFFQRAQGQVKQKSDDIVKLKESVDIEKVKRIDAEKQISQMSEEMKKQKQII